MGIADRKERDRTSMKTMIVEAAMALYLEKGIENVTIRNIAEAIEFSPATIYLYFKDKDQIFFSLYNIAFAEFNAMQMELEKIEDPLERLHRGGHEYIRWALENPKLYDLMFILDIPMNVIAKEECEDIGLQSFNILRMTISQCIERERIKVKNPDLAAMMWWNMLHGVASLIIKGRILYPPEVISSMTTAIVDNFRVLLQK